MFGEGMMVDIKLVNVRDEIKHCRGLMYVVAQDVGCNKCFTFHQQKRKRQFTISKDGKVYAEMEMISPCAEQRFFALSKGQKIVLMMLVGALIKLKENSQQPIVMPPIRPEDFIGALIEACS